MSRCLICRQGANHSKLQRITTSLKQATPSDSNFSSPAAFANASHAENSAPRAAAPLRPEARLWTDPSTDLLQSMGLSLDSLFGPSPAAPNYSSTVNNLNNLSSADFSTANGDAGANWPTPGVFDELFGGSDFFRTGMPVL